jgi:drug/metabolite transporter (DMT)-like permease
MAKPGAGRLPPDPPSMVSAPGVRATGRSRLGGLGRAAASPYVLLVCAMVLWSGNAVVGRAVSTEIPAITLSFWRWAVGFAVLLPVTARAIWLHRLTILRHAPLLTLYCLLGLVGCNLLTYGSLHYTSAVNSSLINSTTPIFVMCLSYLLFGDRIEPRQMTGVLVSLIGVVAIVSGGRVGSLGALALNRGDLMMLASIGLWSTYTALLRRKPEGLPPLAFLAVLMGLGTLIELPPYLVERALDPPAALSLGGLLAILYVGIFPAVIALLFWNRAVATLGANRCSPFVHLMPVFGTGLAVLFLGERFGPHHALGIALILAGVYLASSRRRAA